MDKKEYCIIVQEDSEVKIVLQGDVLYMYVIQNARRCCLNKKRFTKPLKWQVTATFIHSGTC